MKKTIVQIVQPQVVAYCMGTTSGYHEGVAGDNAVKFYDESLYPNQRVLVEGAKLGQMGYVKWTCRGCGDVIYVDGCAGSYLGHYIESGSVHVYKIGLTYANYVFPSSIRYTDVQIPGWRLGFGASIIKNQ